MTTCKSLKMPEHGNDMSHEMVEIRVGTGSEHENFSIHKKLLTNVTKYFDKVLKTDEKKKVNLVLSIDPVVFQMFHEWLYTGKIEKAPTKIHCKERPSILQQAILEEDLRFRFDTHETNLVELYCLAEKLDINGLQDRAIDAIQDGFYEYGTVFGPGLMIRIFENTRKGSQLRELCVAANVLHMDRGCGQLRDEMVRVSRTCPDFMPLMLKWISRNFAMFARRHREGWTPMKRTEGFTMLNRSKLCPCHFHKHGEGEAHKYHKKCVAPYMTCGHEGVAEGEATNGLFNVNLN